MKGISKDRGTVFRELCMVGSSDRTVLNIIPEKESRKFQTSK